MTKKLTICIATYNRGGFIVETLDSIVKQINSNVEIVVVDGASPDNTLDVMTEYLIHHPDIRYYREKENSGVDADYDKCISYAQGEYCWLMTDDDLMVEGAIDRVLSKCDSINELVVVNALVKNNDFSATYADSLLDLTADTDYDNSQILEFYSRCIRYLSFIGGVVVKRDFWLKRDRQSYYGTAFIHVGVMMQEPQLSRVSVIASPLIVIRYGNAMWKPHSFNIWMINWLNLIESFSHFPQKVIQIIAPKDIISIGKLLLIFRAQGYYGRDQYKKLQTKFRLISYVIAISPKRIINALLSICIFVFKPKSKMLLSDLATSKYASFVSKAIAKKLNVI
ncbi:MAG: glycosyltransferase family 2 protein [Pseudomonadota bacterium]